MERASLRSIRNQAEWKSDNYGIEETASIQAARRSAGTEQAGPTPMSIKIWEASLGSEESQPHIRPFSPVFQCQEDKSPQLLAAKPSGD